MTPNRRTVQLWLLAQVGALAWQPAHAVTPSAASPGTAGVAPGIASTAVAPAAATAAMADLDVLYIPPLFLTGQAPKSAEGPARAQAALARLQSQWPALSRRLQAVWPGDATWLRTVQAVQGHVAKSRQLADAGDWPAAHEALEAVRLDLMKARRARGMDYLLDRYTAFHEPMEQLSGMADAPPAGGRLTEAQRAQMAQWFSTARAHWRDIEAAAPQPQDWHMSPTRQAQWRKALADETAALSALSDALRQPDDARLLKAAAAIKSPFIRIYTTFGLGEGENLPA